MRILQGYPVPSKMVVSGGKSTEVRDILASLMNLFNLFILLLRSCLDYSLRDEKVKIRNFAEEIMPEQYNDGWQQKLRMKTHMVEKLVADIRPFMPKITGKELF